MKFLIIWQDGNRGWGKRISNYISENSPDSWQVHNLLMDSFLPDIIENPDDFVTEELPDVEILVVLAENTGLAQLIPDFVSRSAAKAVIAPVDNEEWFPRGLQNQIKKKLEESNVEYAFPRPFCSFVANNQDHGLFKEFNKYFGKPLVSIRCDSDNRIEDYTIIRESPCGVIKDVMENLCGLEINDIERQAGLYHQYYPCLASVDIIHSSAHITETAVKNAVKEEISRV